MHSTKLLTAFTGPSGPAYGNIRTRAFRVMKVIVFPTLGKPQARCQRYFFALARTRVSNTMLRIGECAVWNGFNIVCQSSQTNLRVINVRLTLRYSSQTS